MALAAALTTSGLGHAQATTGGTGATRLAPFAQQLDPAYVGAVVELPAGTFWLGEALHLGTEWHIRGAGRDATRVLLGARGRLVFEGTGSVTLEGITFERKRADDTTTMVVDGDILLTVTDCGFIGGPDGQPTIASSAGLLVVSALPGSRVEGCTFSRHGTGIAHATDLEIVANRFESNGVDLHVFDAGAGVAHHNAFRGNENGIVVTNLAAPALRLNHVIDGGIAGVVWFAATGGSIESSTIEGTWGPGIIVGLDSAPRITSNRIVGNDIGILVVDGAKPTIEDNTITESYYDGIRFCCSSAGLVRFNRIEHSGENAITLRDGARPELRENVLRANGWSGISYAHVSGGVAQANIAERNGNTGVVVHGAARPTLLGNQLRNNVEGGIEYYNEAGGTAVGNVCDGNGTGIELWQDVAPRLRDNACEIEDIRPQVPTVYLTPRGPPVRASAGEAVVDRATHGIEPDGGGRQEPEDAVQR